MDKNELLIEELNEYLKQRGLDIINMLTDDVSEEIVYARLSEINKVLDIIKSYSSSSNSSYEETSYESSYDQS